MLITGFLSGYAEQMRKDILYKGVAVGKDGKVKVKPKYKNAITIKNNKPVISMAFQNKYLDKIFDCIFGFVTPVAVPLAQIDKLFQAGQTKKAKAALAALVTLVSKGTFGAVATKAIGTATNPVLIDRDWETIYLSALK